MYSSQDFSFPIKTIDDSEMTSKYTGRKFAGAEYGTSFSLDLLLNGI